MRRGKQYIKSMNEILTVTSAGMERPSSEPLQLPDINIHRTNSASLAVSTNVRNSFSGSIGSVSVKSLTMQLQRGKEREALRARIAERSNNNNKLAILDANPMPRFSTSMVQPLSSTSALLKAKGGTKYRHDDRHRAEIYAINRLLREHENGLYDEFIAKMKDCVAKGLSTDFIIDGGNDDADGSGNYGEDNDDDDAKSEGSSIVPSPEQRKTVAGCTLTPSSPKVMAAAVFSATNVENDMNNNKKTKTIIPLKSKLSRMLNKEDTSFNAV